MAVSPIPEGYHTVTPYLVVEDADKLIDFLSVAFAAKVNFRSPDAEGKTKHAEIKIGDSVLMIGGAQEKSQITTSMLYLYVKDTDAYYQKALACGATSVLAPTDQFYGDRNAGVKDMFGNQWWIATRVENLSPEEIAKRAEACHKN